MSTRTPNILIVGGGMAGAALALLLRRYGRTGDRVDGRPGPGVTLVEAVALPARGDNGDDGPLGPSFDARSTALSAGTLDIFRDLGVWDALAPYAEPILTVHVSTRGRPGTTRMTAAEQGRDSLGAVVENRALGRALLAAVRADSDIAVLAPARVEQLQRQSAGYRVVLADGQTRDCDLLVAADGAQSSCREMLGIAGHHHDTGHVAMIANVVTAKPHAGMAFERFTDTGPLALLPLTEGRSALVWTGPAEVIKPLLTLEHSEFLTRLQQAFGRRLGTFEKVGERHAYPLVLTHAAAQAIPGAVVVGNAAHTLHPVAGQGFNLTLRDLDALARTVAAAEEPGDLALLRRWEEGRQADQALVSRASQWLPDLFRTRWSPLAHGRQLGLVALDLLPGLRRGFAARAMGLGGASPAPFPAEDPGAS